MCQSADVQLFHVIKGSLEGTIVQELGLERSVECQLLML
jgi:hypothetical protein